MLTNTHRWMNKHRWRIIHRVTNTHRRKSTHRWKNTQVNKHTCGPAATVISEGGLGSRAEAESPQALHRIYKDGQIHTGGQIQMDGQAHTC